MKKKTKFVHHSDFFLPKLCPKFYVQLLVLGPLLRQLVCLLCQGIDNNKSNNIFENGNKFQSMKTFVKPTYKQTNLKFVKWPEVCPSLYCLSHPMICLPAQICLLIGLPPSI